MSLALAGLLCASSGAAQEVGEGVAFPGTRGLRFLSAPAAPSFDTGESTPVAGEWDAVVLQGRSSAKSLRVEGRRRLPGGGWGPWRKGRTRVHEGGRFWARVRLGPAAPGSVQLRLTGGGVSATEVYSVEAFAEGRPEARAQGAPPGPPPARSPAFRREAWGAKPPKEPYVEHSPVKLTVHHTAGRLTASLGESLAEVRFIQDFHQNGRGWNDIGYHFLIDSLGNVFVGRPENAVGSHVRGNNTGNLGVALMGYHHEPRSDAVSPEARAALEKLLRALAADYSIAAAELRGHRDFGSGTSCPGDLAYGLLPELRDRLRQGTPPNRALTGQGPMAAGFR